MLRQPFEALNGWPRLKSLAPRPRFRQIVDGPCLIRPVDRRRPSIGDRTWRRVYFEELRDTISVIVKRGVIARLEDLVAANPAELDKLMHMNASATHPKQPEEVAKVP